MPQRSPWGQPTIALGWWEKPDGIHGADQSMSPGDRFWSACGAAGVKHTEWLLADFFKGFGESKRRRRCCIEKIIEFRKRQYLHRSNLEKLVYQCRTASLVGVNPDITTGRLEDGNGTIYIVFG